ncbi:hypothetical protein GCM10019017_24880 [Streptomyces showdoensis]
MSAMDLAGVAALAALAGIPASVLVAHWRKLTALQQTHALDQAAHETPGRPFRVSYQRVPGPAMTQPASTGLTQKLSATSIICAR